MRRRTSPGRGDRGATIAEFALVLPVLLLLGLGTAEMSMAWVATNKAEAATSQAVRLAAVSGSRVEADRDVLLALASALSAGALENLDRVVIFKPADAQGTVPDGCVKAPGDSSEVGNAGCNTYTGDTVRAVTSGSMVGFGGGVSDLDRYWKPADRNDRLSDPPDYIGVWLRTTHVGPLGSLFGDLEITRASVYRIQPDLTG